MGGQKAMRSVQLLEMRLTLPAIVEGITVSLKNMNPLRLSPKSIAHHCSPCTHTELTAAHLNVE